VGFFVRDEKWLTACIAGISELPRRDFDIASRVIELLRIEAVGEIKRRFTVVRQKHGAREPHAERKHTIARILRLERQHDCLASTTVAKFLKAKLRSSIERVSDCRFHAC